MEERETGLRRAGGHKGTCLWALPTAFSSSELQPGTWRDHFLSPSRSIEATNHKMISVRFPFGCCENISTGQPTPNNSSSLRFSSQMTLGFPNLDVGPSNNHIKFLRPSNRIRLQRPHVKRHQMVFAQGTPSCPDTLGAFRGQRACDSQEFPVKLSADGKLQ